MADKITREEYGKVFETLVKDLTCTNGQLKGVPQTFERLERALRYMVPHYTDYGGYVLAKTYHELCEFRGDPATKEQVRLSCILGWCWQMLLAYLVLIDDIYDDSKCRWGKPTWYYLNERRHIAINDALILEQGIYRLLHKHFSHFPVYSELVEYFSTTSYEYTLGQSAEKQLTIKADEEDNLFTMENYLAYIKCTDLKIFFCGQLHLALILSEHPKNDGIWETVETVCEDLLYLCKVGNDLRDSFRVKPGNTDLDCDIKNGTCVWPIVKAKEICNEEQWRVLQSEYGKGSSTSVEIVKRIYMDLGIPELCEDQLKLLQSQLEQDINGLITDGHVMGKPLRNIFKCVLKIIA